MRAGTEEASVVRRLAILAALVLAPAAPALGADVRFKADAGTPGGWSREWAGVSCESDSRVTRVRRPAAQGRRAYRVQVREGDDSYGERCELEMANTSSRNIDRVGGSRVLFHNGTESWIAQQIMLDARSYAFCGTECALDYDGGLVQQLKQTGACGTPANGIVARNLPGVGVVLEHRNSAENDCGNATMKSLWRVPVRRGAWIRILQHVRWSPDPGTGYIATWINGRPMAPSLAGTSKRVSRSGDEIRIHTWTLKDGPGVDRLKQCRSHPCAHLRSGVYRDPKVSGSSVVYVDGTTVATTRAAAERGAGLRRR